ncbi:MAG: YHYH protein [Proteobacteria bacterium]|nr:YHYH protein [Pseudomonadota bacterium]
MFRLTYYLLFLALVLAVSVGDAMAAGATAPKTIAALQKSGHLGVTLKRGDGTLSVTFSGPSHKTGAFPMMGDSDGDGRPDTPNTIQSRTCTYSIPLRPRKAPSPGKLGRGPIAISISGTPFFSMETHLGGDAVKSEVFDQCQGHPDQRGTYHYHQYSACMGEKTAADGHAGLIGWSPDGYGIYGLGGKTLDRCNGHDDAGRGYHYHTTSTPP